MDGFRQVINYLDDFNGASIILRLVLSCIFGGIIGMERERKRHSAGFRTFTLVCLGSALATIANLYLFNVTGSADTSRIPAGIVSGIGFLGVGTIIVTNKNHVKGLTTAAALWVTGCLGIALGAGMVSTGVLSFILILITMSILQHLSSYVSAHNRIMTLYLEVQNEEEIDKLLSFFKERGYTILTVLKRKDKVSKGHISLSMEIDLHDRLPHTDVILDISKLEGIAYIEEV